MDDWQLLQRYGREDSQDAFTEIVKRHVNLVYSAALRQVREVELAKDVTQLVFANLARRAKSLKPSGTLAGWLHRDTCFTSLDVLRRERRRQAREQEAVAMQESNTEHSQDWTRIQPGLDAALSELPAVERDALLLRFFEERSLKDVGSALGLHEDAARKRVARALEKLRVVLAKRGVTTTSAALSVALTTYSITSVPAGLAASVVTTSLAAGSAAVGGVTTWKFIELLTMTKLKMALATAALVASLGTPLVLQYQTNKSLRAENEMLLAQASHASDLQAENQRLSNRDVQTVSNSLSDGQIAELARLRGEVPRLRADANQTEKLRQEINRLRTARVEPPKTQPPNTTSQDTFPRETWAFAGYASPESAMQSFAWAALQGDMNTFLNSLSPEGQSREREKWQKDGSNETQIRDGLVKEFGKTKAIRIEEKRAISDTEVILSLFIEHEKGDSETAKLKVQRIDNEWKMVGPQDEDK
jgi:RNA polymerase sigma factor (sigma-70 family)